VSLCDSEFPLAKDKDHILPFEIRTLSHRAFTVVLQDYQQALHVSTNFMGPLFMLYRVNPALIERIFTNGAVFPLLSQTWCSLLRVMSFFIGSLLLRLAAQGLLIRLVLSLLEIIVEKLELISISDCVCSLMLG
jgi:hypothetical protein